MCEPGYVSLNARSLAAEVEQHDGVAVLALTDDEGNIVDIHPGAEPETGAAATHLDLLADRVVEYAATLRRRRTRESGPAVPGQG